jgi:hypothetical protein
MRRSALSLPSLALLSTLATISSSSSSSLSTNPLLLAFAPPATTTTTTTTATTRANDRIRRTVLARTILHSFNNNNNNHSDDYGEPLLYSELMMTTDNKQEEKRRQKKQQQKSSNDEDTSNGDDSLISTVPLGETLGEMVDQQREFEINLGRAVDTLKRDYPKLLTHDPEWNIYHSNLEVIDPTGVSLHGLSNYRRAFSFIHAVVYMFYCEEKSGLTFRTVYDWARKCIR